MDFSRELPLTVTGAGTGAERCKGGHPSWAPPEEAALRDVKGDTRAGLPPEDATLRDVMGVSPELSSPH